MKKAILLMFLTSCNPFNYFPDNPIEERIEEKIMEETGISVDLSGSTPEK